ncbi:sigma-54-dependent transcriptional regulator [Undibacterium griseum]|uniref:Sigma-54-dependent Fis family transcriptional regulator n=1 Tax=Undibacterium griseum TaxID=2762295 RepID=A0ABR6YJR3_9BURK|nr:sigma-54 dependent transcriptional regulator [Undibacterium griseum]MBC3884118.1 sigma-54-dependent Fis family transcriptional regulator [Undibacterium griseum]
MSETILIVEDDHTIRVTVGNFLSRQGFDVELAENGEQALALLKKRGFSLVLLDLRLPDMNGLDALAKLRESDDPPLVVIMTAFPEVRTAVAALKAGAYDYINKPFDLEDLLELIGRAQETQRLRREIAWLRAQSANCVIEGLIGSSSTFKNMLETTARIASAGKVPVLIRGESGTGKEGVAQAIHQRSARAGGPWVTLNCSALPEGLLESEMFGHERGAFTDARQMKRGLLELADGGTLFLDEIGDLALALQPKLLRVLETQTFRRLGGQKEISVDVRFVSATHRDLPNMVQAGQFREDLYYRLNVGAIDIPPLRERQEDIMALAQHFLEKTAPVIGINSHGIDVAIEPLLKTYRWPGNVRELRNVIERAAILSMGQTISVQHLPKEMIGHGSQQLVENGESDTGIRPLAEFEVNYISHVLSLCHGNKTQAAELLGITRLTLRNKLREHGETPDT